MTPAVTSLRTRVESRYAIPGKVAIGCHKCALLHERLRDQHPVEWISVKSPERSQRSSVPHTHGKLDEPVGADHLLHVIDKHELSKRLFDFSLPRRGCANENEFARPDSGPGNGTEPFRILFPPEQCIRVEQ